MAHMVDHLTNRGLPRGVIYAIMQSARQLGNWSPSLLVRSKWFTEERVVEFLPPIVLIHGTSDKSMPHSVTKEFAEALEDVGACVTTRYYDHCTHTDPILESPFLGHDFLQHDLISLIEADSEQFMQQENEHQNEDEINGEHKQFADEAHEHVVVGSAEKRIRVHGVLTSDSELESNTSKTSKSSSQRRLNGITNHGTPDSFKNPQRKSGLRYRLPIIRRISETFLFFRTLPLSTAQQNEFISPNDENKQNSAKHSQKVICRSKPICSPFFVKCARVFNPF